MLEGDAGCKRFDKLLRKRRIWIRKDQGRRTRQRGRVRRLEALRVEQAARRDTSAT